VEVKKVMSRRESGILGSAGIFLAVLLLAAPAAVPAAEKIIRHTVGKGDTLMLLAGYYYKDPRQWKQIYDLNREALKGPHLLYPGTILEVEADPSLQWAIPYADYFSRVFD
jgi:nucleoid-associated protein YgaU